MISSSATTKTTTTTTTTMEECDDDSRWKNATIGSREKRRLLRDGVECCEGVSCCVDGGGRR
jgi:hypothetical protein